MADNTIQEDKIEETSSILERLAINSQESPGRLSDFDLQLVKVTSPGEGDENLIHPASLRDDEYYARRATKAIEKQGGLIVIEDKDDKRCIADFEKEGIIVIATLNRIGKSAAKLIGQAGVDSKPSMITECKEEKNTSPVNVLNSFKIFTPKKENIKEDNISIPSSSTHPAPLHPHSSCTENPPLHRTGHSIAPPSTIQPIVYPQSSSKDQKIKIIEDSAPGKPLSKVETCEKITTLSSLFKNISQQDRTHASEVSNSSSKRNGNLQISVDLCKSLSKSLDLDPWLHPESSLVALSKYIFSELGLVATFEIGEETLNMFLINVRDCYSRLHYHNFRRAVCSLQFTYLLLSKGKLVSELTFIEVFGLVLSSLCLDVDHPGVNNDFIKKSDCIGLYCGGNSLEVGDNYVLEKHHYHRLLSILERPGCNILQGLTAKELDHLYIIIQRCFISSSPDYRVGKTISKFMISEAPYDRSNFNHRGFLVELIMVAADLSGFIRPYKVAKFWGDLLQEEYFIQGDKEKENNYEVSRYMDRENPKQGGYISKLLQKRAIPALEFLKNLTDDIEDIFETATEAFELWKSERYLKEWLQSKVQ